ncbi:MAG: NADP-dependent malic enzyme [Clostridia bacterium]|nr:NADP-dependent malic enzyme [Clostridia bacterium]
MDIKEKSLKKHYEWRGKIEMIARCPAETREDLSLCYTPGVAEACTVIAGDKEKVYELTRRGNIVAVITDGSAVLGLGDIGPEASMPVMEGKCALFKAFADVDAFPICVKTQSVDEIVRTVSLISSSFGGINLEDISAPRCFEIEKRLKEVCDIPVFHDDQHGTAVVVAAALLNAIKVAKKDKNARIVLNGAGSAGIAIAKHLINVGFTDITLCDRFGVLHTDAENMNEAQAEMARVTNPRNVKGSLSDAMKDADVFIGVSAPNVVSEDMVRSMAERAIVFPMANPTPEIMPDKALAAGAFIVGTGRSDFKNQINNVLAFPGIFRGALDCRAREINEEMKVAASLALAEYVKEDELSPDCIIPSALDRGVSAVVAKAVADAARKSGVARC